ncbi:sulfotransferase family protein [Glycomyces xiaoerkulensis]|uniref:sulfotransferase family protein n=1 Tax=Glycomyces xiaoerkulensis TaxID=2038139 RepID=UPI0013000213|nr:sulfotransferase [Glycomyces xiaoerkulensis]
MRKIPTRTRVLNALLEPNVFPPRPVDEVFGALVARAETADGGSAEGDEDFLDGYRTVLHYYSDVPSMTPVGWQAVLDDLELRIRNRLRVRRLIHDRPAISDEPVGAPVLVVGLARTAAPITREAIARSVGHRAPLLWEMLYTDLEAPEKERRRYIKAATQHCKSVGRLSPHYRDLHRFEAESPGDSSHLLRHGVHHLARAHMPGYLDRLAGHDWHGDYEHLKLVLQVLQHGRGDRRWILHSAAHLDHLPTIRDVFPDATVVWVHRDPVTVMGSVCSLAEAATAVHVKDPDLHRIGATWLELTAASIERARAARLELPREAIVDVPYTQLQADPHGAMTALYERLGTRSTGADRANLEAALSGPATGRSHEFDLARYGLTTDDVEGAFGDYTRTIDRLRLR